MAESVTADINKILVAGACVAAGAYGVYWATRPGPHPALQAVKPYIKKPFPLAIKAIFTLPDCLLNLLLPAPALNLPDSNSIFGENSHVVEEVSPDLLTVSYMYGMEGAMVGMTVADIDDKKGNELLANATSKPTMVDDLSLIRRAQEVPVKQGEKSEFFNLGYQMEGFMAAIKLSNGDVVIYNPVKISEKVKARIMAVGTVKWIISPSASHTLFMKSAADAFPEAKVVASATAAAKFKKVGVKLDYDYTRPRQMAKLKEAFSGELELHHVRDPLSATLVMVQPRTGLLFECDLLYPDVEGEDWQKRFISRVFVETSIKTSPNQMLPFYRFVPHLGGFFPTVPKPSSNCRQNTLEDLQFVVGSMTYTKVWSAHFGIWGDAQRFQSYISKAWLLWLKDPNVLLKKAP